MYVKLNCLISIETKAGKVIRFQSVNGVEIEKSIDELQTRAIIRIPASARLVSANTIQTESVQIAKVFNAGDKVNIQLGYDEKLTDEFDGYIRKINIKTPLEISCEGCEYLLRDNVDTKTFKSTNLKEVIKYVVGDSLLSSKQITLDEQIPAVVMSNYVIPANLTRINALKQLKEKYGLTMFFYSGKLYAGLDFVKYFGSIIYSLGWNTPRSDELEYQVAEDVRLKVKAIHINKDNTKLEAEVGEPDGSQRTVYFYSGVKSVSDLKKLAQSQLDKLKYTGYTGKITTFLEPYSAPGMVADIRDINYPERNGKYEIRSVHTTFGENGARRTIEIGKPLSNG
jgi:hypothetical protein